MASWSLVYAAGPKYNRPCRVFDAADLKRNMKICHNAIYHVLDVLRFESLTAVESALIETMPVLYREEGRLEV